MMQLAIEEPKIEQFFHHSKEEIIKALEFIVENNIQDFSLQKSDLELSDAQKKELDERNSSYHANRDIGRSWNDVKSDLNRDN